jgi:hypothetical protein
MMARLVHPPRCNLLHTIPPRIEMRRQDPPPSGSVPKLSSGFLSPLTCSSDLVNFVYPSRGAPARLGNIPPIGGIAEKCSRPAQNFHLCRRRTGGPPADRALARRSRPAPLAVRLRYGQKSSAALSRGDRATGVQLRLQADWPGTFGARAASRSSAVTMQALLSAR